MGCRQRGEVINVKYCVKVYRETVDIFVLEAKNEGEAIDRVLSGDVDKTSTEDNGIIDVETQLVE